MTQNDLLQILCCPESHQPLANADAALVQKINERIAAGQIKSHAGQAITQPVTGGYVRQDGRLFFPTHDGIPMLLITTALVLD